MTSFSEEMRRRGMTPGEQDAVVDDDDAPARTSARCLHVSPSESIMVAKRLRLADGESMAIETLHVPESLVPGLTPKDLDQGSFYELLAERYGIKIVGGMQTIEPTVTNEEESEALDVPAAFAGVPVRAHDQRSETGDIVEFVRSIYRGDRYRLVSELNRRERTGSTPVFMPRDGGACRSRWPGRFRSREGARISAPAGDPRAARRAGAAPRTSRRVRGCRRLAARARA